METQVVERRGFLRLRQLAAASWRLGKISWPELTVFVAYVVLTVGMTYPVAFRLGTHIAGGPTDAFEHLWTLWWGKKAMWDLHTSMANLSYFYYPWGAQHPLLSVTPLVQVAAMSFEVLFTPLVAYNLAFLSSYVLTAFTTYLLCRYVTKNRWAAFVGGLIYGFAPTRMIHGFGHLAELTTYWFPLYALFVLKLIDHPNWKNGMWAGVFMGISALVNFVLTAYFVMIFTLVWLTYVFLARQKLALSSRFLRAAGLAFGIAGALVLPFFAPFIVSEVNPTVHYILPGGSVGNTTTPLTFLTQSPWHPLVRALGLSEQVDKLLAPNPIESWAYLGVLPLLLAVWGALKNRGKAGLWLVYGLTTVVLSMGPFLRLGNDPLVIDRIDGMNVYVPLPYILLRFLPFFKMGRTPGRIAIGTPLALAVLVSLGVVQVQAWMRRKWRRGAWFAVALLPAFILFEYCVTWPYIVTPAPIPAFYESVGREEGDFGIVDYPLNCDKEGPSKEFSRVLYYQTAHEHPIAGGQVWRLMWEGVGATTMINDLVAPKDEAAPNIVAVERSDRERVQWLSELGFRYVALHKFAPRAMNEQNRRPVERTEAERQYFTSLFSTPVFEDDHIIAYRVPAVDKLPPGVQPLTAIGYGWHQVESEPGRPSRRWLEQEGLIQVHSALTRTYRLGFNAYSFEHPREVNLLVNDEPVYTTTINAERQFLTPQITLRSGWNTLILKAVTPCERPAEVDAEHQEDQRCLSISLSGLTWEDARGAYEHSEQGAQFGGYFRLLGYELDHDGVDPGSMVHLKLYWEVLKRPDRNYTVFTHVWDAERGFAGQKDNEPVSGAYHTTWFGSGEIIEDQYDIPVRQDAEPGIYTLQVGWYDSSTGERLPLASDPNSGVLRLADIVVRAEGS